MNAQKFVIALISLGLIFPQLAEACSCGPDVSAPACARIGRLDVAFLGTPVAIVQDDSVAGQSPRDLYKFKVERVYKGLDRNLTEVMVDPATWSDCAVSFELGVRYVVNGAHSGTAGQVATSSCARPFKAADFPEDVKFLESFEKGIASSSVVGRVLQQEESRFSVRDTTATIPGARITLTRGRQTWETVTDQTGAFKLDVQPGPYSLTVAAPGFGAIQFPEQVDPPPAACVEVFPVLPSHTNISGRLVDARGVAVVGLEVEAVRIAGQGSRSFGSVNTDDQGEFEFTDLPTGDYRLQVESREESPFPGRFYPGVPDESAAAILHLDPNRAIRNLVFRLDTKHTTRDLRVELVWPDGSPVTQEAQLRNGKEPLDAQLIAGSEYTFPAFQERKYELSATVWLDGFEDEKGDPIYYDDRRLARSKAVTVLPGADAQRIRIVLTEQLRAGDAFPF